MNVKKYLARTFSIDLHKISFFEQLWLLTPLTVWLSYQPLIRLGQDSTMYFELSVALLHMGVLAMAGIPHVWAARTLLMQNRAVLWVGTFVAWSILSLLWTPNLTRGILTVGVSVAVYIILLASIATMQKMKRLLPLLTHTYIAMAVTMSLLACIQFIVGIWLERHMTLLCAGCAATQFGFVRPNVFAIEPQFFGSLLLVPLLVTAHRLLTEKWQRWRVISFALMVMALFFTLSRGAIFAFGLGCIVLTVLHRRNTRRLLGVGVLCVGVFIASLAAQGIAAAINPSIDETFKGAVSKTVNQLSLGKIRIPIQSVEGNYDNEPAPVFNGYVEESTDARVSRSTLALHAWLDTPLTMLFGTGVGSAGVAMHRMSPDQIGTREIVQNQYLEVLLEHGSIGLVLFGMLLIGLFVVTRSQKWLWSLMAAFLFQWLFFSGYPNALHIYFVFIAIYSTHKKTNLKFSQQ